MDEKDRRVGEKIINLKVWKLRKKHKRLFNFLNKIKKLFKKDKNNKQNYNNGFRKSVNH
jgi:hypothetical protein